MGLLALAAQARSIKGAPHFSVLTVNHGSRKAAVAEAAQVAAQCEKFNLPHVALMADTNLRKSDFQQQARNMRYRLMSAWCAEHGARGLVVAHHRDDQAETVLMRMARGSGMSGLSGMAPRQLLYTETAPLLLLRPLLKYGGAELKALAYEAGLPVIDDPSNYDPKFERVRWRRLLPLLQAEGLGAARLAEIAAEMRLLQAALDEKLTAWLDHHASWHDYGVLSLPRTDFDALPLSHKQRFIGRFVQYFGQHAHPVKRRKADRLLRQIEETPHGGASAGGLHLRWRKRHVFLGREAAACPEPVAISDMTLNLDGPFDSHFDRRFALSDANGAKHFQLGALGPHGVAEMRARGFSFDKAVPAAYYAALPGIFDGDKLLHCPLFSSSAESLADFKLHSVYYRGFYRDIIAGRQG